MPQLPSEPLTKITLNLYAKDVEWFKDRYGDGYSTMIRAVIRHNVERVKESEQYYDGRE